MADNHPGDGSATGILWSSLSPNLLLIPIRFSLPPSGSGGLRRLKDRTD